MTESSTPAERWVPVPGYEGYYEVSDLGRIRSVRIRRYSLNDRGYAMIWLARDGEKRYVPVHRVVGEAFLGPLPSGLMTRHGPGGKLDNRLVNLSYGTNSENQIDRRRDGNPNTGFRGEAHPASKLTDAIVAECRRRHSEGETQYSLSREFGVTVQAMHNAIRRKTWQHVP